jgi:hypothetical protein
MAKRTHRLVVGCGLVAANFLVFAAGAAASVKDLPDLLVGGLQGVANNKTGFGVTDGNPFAAPEYFTADTFDRFALNPFVSPGTDVHSLGFDVRTSYSEIPFKDFSSSATLVSPGFFARFGDRVGLSISLPLQYRSVADADVFIAGGTVGLPINVVLATEGGFSWQVTPWVNTGVAASADLAQGGWIYGLGVASSLEVVRGSWAFTYGLQVAWEGGVPIGYSSNYDFKQNVSQPILKNGLKAEYLCGALVPFASITYTNLLEGGYIDNYWTPELGCRWNVSERWHLSAGYVGNYANGYTSNGATVTLGFEF